MQEARLIALVQKILVTHAPLLPSYSREADEHFKLLHLAMKCFMIFLYITKITVNYILFYDIFFTFLKGHT